MKKIRTLILSTLLAVCGVLSFAEVPASYYSTLTGKKDGELKTAIYNIVHNFTRVSSYSALPQYFAAVVGHVFRYSSVCSEFFGAEP